jgi:hypothetical protein
MAAMVTVVRPTRSASTPPTTAPAKPAIPMIAKANSRAVEALWSASARKSVSQVHIA